MLPFDDAPGTVVKQMQRDGGIHMSKLITGLFNEVFDRPYVEANPDDRVRIQKSTYLLERLGLEVGDYLFLWDTQGPYSLELRAEVLGEIQKTESEIKYSQFTKEKIESVQRIIKCGEALGCSEMPWLETICSLHYLKNYVIATGRDALSALEEKKPHLYSSNAPIVNTTAYDIVNTIDNMGCFDDDSNCTIS